MASTYDDVGPVQWLLQATLAEKKFGYFILALQFPRYTYLCLTWLPPDERVAMAFEGLRPAPTLVALAGVGCLKKKNIDFI